MPILPDQPNLEAVLSAFSAACPAAPTADQLRDWVAHHPEHAEDLVVHAAILIAEEVRRRSPATAHDQDEASVMDGADGQSLEDLLDAHGLDLPELARRTGMRREVLTKLYGGLLELPIPGRLMSRMADTLEIDISMVKAAIIASHANPMALQAKSTAAPTIVRQTYAAALEASGMPAEERNYWLSGG